MKKEIQLARIALVKPEKARGVEDVLTKAAQMGQTAEKLKFVSEERLLSLLEQINTQTETDKTHNLLLIQRCCSVLEDDD
ncbi:hypothetical protein CsSME_00031466 [Camellia sinensis var. sinensis]